MNRIQESFDQLRREEEAAAPSFAQVLERRVRARRAASRWAVAFAAIVLLVTALLVVARREHERPQSYAFPQWKAPTDFLLDTPGAELTHDVPAIGMTEIPKGVVR